MASPRISMTITKALTFRASSIGDCLMGKYLLDNIHQQFPHARLGIVVASRGAMIRDLLAQYPYIEVIETNRFDLRGLWRLWRAWRGSDLVVTQYRGKRAGSFSLRSKIAARLLARRGGYVGFTDDSLLSPLLFDKTVPDSDDYSPAEDERRALRAAGLAVLLSYPALEAPAQSRAVEKFALHEGKYIVVHLFSGSIKRGLAPAKQRELVRTLSAALPAMQLVLTGGRGDAALARDAAGGEGRSIAGEATLQEMTELIWRAAAVVSLDTGVAHMAAQMHKPVFVLSTCMGLWWWNEEQYGPDATFKVFTAPVHTVAEHVMEDYPECLNAVPAENIVAAIARI